MRRAKISYKWLLVAFTFAATTLAVLLIANLTLRAVPAQHERAVRAAFGDMLKAIRGARETITFESYIYWSGDTGAAFTRALAQRARAGVKVHLLFDALGSGKIDDVVPGKQTDSPAVRRASRSTWGELLQAGIEIYEYQPTFFHCKVMIVDDLWVSVGSTNFDDQSFSVNDEANLNVYDPEFALAQARIFADDLAQAKRISYEEWKNRPWTEKLWQNTLGLVRSQL